MMKVICVRCRPFAMVLPSLSQSTDFVLELAEQGEILTWLRKFGSFEVDCAKFYCAQVLSAVEHMHAKGIIHRCVCSRVRIVPFTLTQCIAISSPRSALLARSVANSFL